MHMVPMKACRPYASTHLVMFVTRAVHNIYQTTIDHNTDSQLLPGIIISLAQNSVANIACTFTKCMLSIKLEMVVVVVTGATIAHADGYTGLIGGTA